MDNKTLKTKINSILKKIPDDDKLVEVLQDVIEIATYFENSEIIDWVSKEISGYLDDDKVPSYRFITCVKKENKEKDVVIPYRFEVCINSIIKDSKGEKKILYRTTSTEEGTYEISVNNTELQKIIDSVKGKIREYLTKISREKLESSNKTKEKRKKQILEDLSSSSLKTYFKDAKESNIIKSELNSLMDFESLSNYKYSIIAMGSILEFLLKRYCDAKGIIPAEYHPPSGGIQKGNNFVNYIQAAINCNIFSEMKRWQIVQNDLRDFRNYVHIEKEIKSTEIDKNWYNTMRPAFDALYEHFKKNPI